jgi:hypothetical protein
MKRALLAALIALAAPAVAAAQPEVSRTCGGSVICDKWFTSPTLLDWTYAGTVTTGCVDERFTEDTKGSLRVCTVREGGEGGETVSRTVTIRLDQTPPTITDAVPDRPPDHDGWYTRPVTFVPTGADATSGLLGCESVTYAGPDSADARITAGCRDVAGHVATRAFALRYDATAPDVSTASAAPGDRVVRLAWPAGAGAEVVRTPGTGGAGSTVVYRGPATGFADRKVRNARRYRYDVTLVDQAGNAATRELVAVPGPHLLEPARRAVLTAPPTLRWTPVRGARYYNVQLLRDGRKILSAWPREAALPLEASWRYRGKRRRLAPGEYQWYVWPGEGRRAANEYGPRVGARSFTLAG